MGLIDWDPLRLQRFRRYKSCVTLGFDAPNLRINFLIPVYPSNCSICTSELHCLVTNYPKLCSKFEVHQLYFQNRIKYKSFNTI